MKREEMVTPTEIGSLAEMLGDGWLFLPDPPRKVFVVLHKDSGVNMDFHDLSALKESEVQAIADALLDAVRRKTPGRVDVILDCDGPSAVAEGTYIHRLVELWLSDDDAARAQAVEVLLSLPAEELPHALKVVARRCKHEVTWARRATKSQQDATKKHQDAVHSFCRYVIELLDHDVNCISGVNSLVALRRTANLIQQDANDRLNIERVRASKIKPYKVAP